MKTCKALVWFLLLTRIGGAAQVGNFVHPDRSDNGRPLLLQGGLANENDNGWESPILVGSSPGREVFTTHGLLSVSVRSFHAEGRYLALLYTYYEGDEFCKNIAASFLKDEFVKSCKLVGYRRSQLQVDTKKRAFQISSIFLDRNGYWMAGIIRKGALPEGWIPFDSVTDKDRAIIQIIDSLTSLVKREEEKSKGTIDLFCPD